MNKKSEDFVENIVEADYSESLESMYIDYAMSVIVDRAVPDVRDGLKPVQRRVLYAMRDMGCTSDKPTMKTARVVGEAMGKYHPHGDSALESSIVVMAQDFKRPLAFIEGQGNFGSLEGDEAAAPRYTEVRLTEFSEECLLRYLFDDTVDWHANYDETMREPDVLPSIIPSVLLGSEGIAVGMTTNIPPHNVSELIDAAIYRMQHESASTKQLMRYVPAPDFPTGGIICNEEDLHSIYDTGEGKIRIRGEIEFEEGKKRDKLIITSVPYTIVGKGVEKLLETIAELVDDRTLEDVVDIVNQTAEDVRIVLEVKKNADIEYMKRVLYAKTKLEDVMGVHLLAIRDKKPAVMGLSEIFDAYYDFQMSIFTRKFEHDLAKLEDKRDILDGKLKIIEDIDNALAIIKKSESTSDAKAALMKNYGLNERQSSSIVGMTLSSLVKSNVEDIEKSLSSVLSEIDGVKSVLSDDSLLKKGIVKNLRKMKRKFGYDRKTKIDNISQETIKEQDKPAKEVGIVIDSKNYVHIIDKNVFYRNMEAIDQDFEHAFTAMDDDVVCICTSKGVAHKIPISKIPYGNLRAKGELLDNLSNFSMEEESVVYAFPINEVSEIFVVTKDGKSKRVSVKELSSSRKSVDYVTLNKRDFVVSCMAFKPNAIVALEEDGRLITSFRQKEVPLMSRKSKGKNSARSPFMVSGVKIVTTDDLKETYKVEEPGEFGTAQKPPKISLFTQNR